MLPFSKTDSHGPGIMLQALLVFLLLLSTGLVAGEIYPRTPDKIDPDKAYIFYLHGRIIQEQGLRPVHPRLGLYDYPAILDALAQPGITVISERRAKGTVALDYAARIVTQVERLVAAGVDPRHITVVGFSAGGEIAIRTSSILPDTGINFVFLASCWGWTNSDTTLHIHGRVLSIFEKTDRALSCADLAERSPGLSAFSEIAINTGKQHGAFYLPRDEWVVPLLDWARVQ